MAEPTYWLIKTGTGEHWEDWKEEPQVISVGWDVGEVKDLSKNEIDERIREKFGDDNPGSSTNAILTIAGQHPSEKKSMEEGDYVIVIGKKNINGNSVIYGAAEIGDYEYVEEGVDGTGRHTYQRHVSYCFDEGPIKKSDLSEDFQQGGNHSLHLAQTRQRWTRGDKDAFNRLVSELNELNPVEQTHYKEKMINSYLENNKDEIESALDQTEVCSVIENPASERYITENGDNRVDLFCTMADGSILIIEIKVGEAKLDALDPQLLNYLDETRKVENKEVNGAVVAKSFTQELKNRASKENVPLLSYSIESELSVID